MTAFVNEPNIQPKAKVIITCLSTGEQVRFFPYDFEFDDIFRPEWGTYDGFGRMDPVMTYKRTSRTANLSFNVVAESEKNSRQNFQNLQTLIRGLYPAYIKPVAQDSQFLVQQLDSLRNLYAEEQNNQQSSEALIALPQEIQKIETQITSDFTEQNQIINDFGIAIIDRSPLFQISFMNLLNNDEYVVAVTNFKHKMKFDAADTSLNKDGKAIPGEFNINMAFTILHTYTPGDDKKAARRLNYNKVYEPPKR